MKKSPKKLTKEQKVLRRKIFKVLKEQGFKINPHVRPAVATKEHYRKIQSTSRLEQISHHQNFLQDFLPYAKEHCINGKDIIPENISLELRLVQPNTKEENFFRWWNFVWWSVPYQHPYGRQLRFLLWDKTHDAPFGLILLQSPVLRLSVRDNYLKIPKEELDIWINKSMSAQRVGALPPYNDLLGGKMVALTLTANEIRDAYREKYDDTITLMKKRKIEPDLLFITTTSAFGKSSMYDRLKYNGELVAHSIGYTQGAGSFHIPLTLYEDMILFLKHKGINVARGYGNGPSRKVKLIYQAFERLQLPNFVYHGIKREFYLFPLASNLRNVIHGGQKPLWFNRPFSNLIDYWKERWAIPRSKNNPKWKEFTVQKYFNKVENMLNGLDHVRN